VFGFSGTAMSERPPFGPSIVLAKLWAGVSPKGTRGLAGRLAAARITVVHARDCETDTDHTHVLMLSQADPAAAPTQEYGPSIDLCGLEEKTSGRGTTYLAGYIAGARVVIVRNPNRQSDADPAFILRLTETKTAAPQRQAAQLTAANDGAGESPALPAPVHASRPHQARMRLPQASRPRTPDHVRYPNRARARAAEEACPLPSDPIPF
jgi:hypothetical protein